MRLRPPKAPIRLNLEYAPPGRFKPDPKNARGHSKRQVAALGSAMMEFDFTNPIQVDENDIILAGHARWQAAINLALKEIPFICIPHLTAAQKIAFALSDNKIGDLSSFIPDQLVANLRELTQLAFEIELTGFSTAETDILLHPPVLGGSSDSADSFALPCVESDRPAVSRLGSFWKLGRHHLLCGSALDASSYQRVLQGEKAQLVFTDPPFNVQIQGHVSGQGRNRHREFVMASGEMSADAFTTFLATFMRHAADHSVDGSIHYIMMDWRHLPEVLAAGGSVYTELKNLCVWNKTNAGMGSLYRSQHELVLVYKNGTAPHINNVELGRHGRWRSNIWPYAGANSFHPGRDEDLAAHSTTKPIGLVADALRDCSKRNGLVLDAYGGSGTTALAAERTGRRAALIELDPLYVDVAVERWQRLTGKCAVLDGDGRTFAEVAAEPRDPADTASPAMEGTHV